jgi:PAS domain S-box-containing protein
VGIVVIRDNQGQITNYISVNRDISQRQKAEQALAEGETLFRTLSEKSLAGIYIIQDRRLIYVNSALADMLGYLPDEMIGADPLFFIHPDDRAQGAESMLLRLAGKVKNAQFKFRGICKNGELKQLEFLGTRVEMNGLPAIIGNIIDITERKRTGEV